MQDRKSVTGDPARSKPGFLRSRLRPDNHVTLVLLLGTAQLGRLERLAVAWACPVSAALYFSPTDQLDLERHLAQVREVHARVEADGRSALTLGLHLAAAAPTDYAESEKRPSAGWPTAQLFKLALKEVHTEMFLLLGSVHDALPSPSLRWACKDPAWAAAAAAAAAGNRTALVIPLLSSAGDGGPGSGEGGGVRPVVTLHLADGAGAGEHLQSGGAVAEVVGPPGNDGLSAWLAAEVPIGLDFEPHLSAHLLVPAERMGE